MNEATKERLKGLSSICREVKRTEERLKLLRAKRSESNSYKISLEGFEEHLCDYLERVGGEEKSLMKYINEIEDATTREIFMLRYYDGIRSWQRIAFLAGDHDESYVRRLHNAYIKAHPYI